MKRIICLLFILILTFSGCTRNDDATFRETENGSIISDAGIEYAHLAYEGVLYYLGETEFVGSVQGEGKRKRNLEELYPVGVFAVDGNDHILIRRKPNSEWCSIYRRADLPPLDFSLDNCARLEFVAGWGNIREDAIHAFCGDGITDRAEIAAFFSQVQMQKDPDEAGLYDLVRNQNGILENCYVCGVLYGFFEEETNLAIQMQIISYNDLAYSVEIGGEEYVLPESLLQMIKDATRVA